MKEEDLLLIDDITEILSNNGVVIMPCDTIYGIIGIAPNSDERIREIKGRDEVKPFLILIKKDWITRYTNIIIDNYLLDLWPGPITLIVPDLNDGSIALRAPDDRRLQKILTKLDQPLFSTSVNRSGQDLLFESSDIKKEFISEIDLFIDEGDMPGGLPSTILDIRKTPFKIIRQGACLVDLKNIRI
jgi:L-threonylcarbamoyladenylate synthase